MDMIVVFLIVLYELILTPKKNCLICIHRPMQKINKSPSKTTIFELAQLS